LIWSHPGSNLPAMPRIVVNQGALGDLLLSLPALRLLRKHAGEFTLAATPEVALFLKRAGEVSSALPSSAAGFHQLYSGAVPAILRYFDEFFWFTRRRGLVPDLLLRPDYEPECRVIFTVYEGADPLHCAMFQFQQVAKELGIEAAEFKDYLYPLTLPSPSAEDQGDNEAGAGISGRHLFDAAIHPGSGSAKKNWPIEKFLALADRLLEPDGAKVLFLLGPADGKLTEQVRQYVVSRNQKDGKQQAFLAENLPLEQVAGLLARCRRYIGNDSGITHLAAWCGVETTALFGPTDPRIWSPPHDWVKVIRSPAECSPCGDNYRECKDVRCMEMIPL